MCIRLCSGEALTDFSTQQRLWFFPSSSSQQSTSQNRSQADQQEWSEITFLIPQIKESSRNSPPVSESDVTPGVNSSRRSGSAPHSHICVFVLIEIIKQRNVFIFLDWVKLTKLGRDFVNTAAWNGAEEDCWSPPTPPDLPHPPD